MAFAFLQFFTTEQCYIEHLVYKFLCGHRCHFSWTYMPKKWNFCIINIPCLSFWGIHNCFLKWAHHFAFLVGEVASSFPYADFETCYFLSFWSNHPLWSGCSLWFLICISLVTPMLGIFLCAEWPFRSLKGLFRFLAHLLVGLFVFLLLSCKTSIYSGYKSFIRYMTCRYPFPSHRLSFHFRDGFVLQHKSLKFWCSCFFICKVILTLKLCVLLWMCLCSFWTIFSLWHGNFFFFSGFRARDLSSLTRDSHAPCSGRTEFLPLGLQEVPASESLKKKICISLIYMSYEIIRLYPKCIECLKWTFLLSLERTLSTFYNLIFSTHILEFYVFHWKGIMPHTLLLIFNFYLVLQFYWRFKGTCIAV